MVFVSRNQWAWACSPPLYVDPFSSPVHPPPLAPPSASASFPPPPPQPTSNPLPLPPATYIGVRIGRDRAPIHHSKPYSMDGQHCAVYGLQTGVLVTDLLRVKQPPTAQTDSWFLVLRVLLCGEMGHRPEPCTCGWGSCVQGTGVHGSGFIVQSVGAAV